MLYIRNVFIFPNLSQFPAAMIHMKKKKKHYVWEANFIDSVTVYPLGEKNIDF